MIEAVKRAENLKWLNSIYAGLDFLPLDLLPKGITEVRTVEIIGLDLQADGGTHVHNTREIGSMKVVDYKSKGKINKRIYVEIGG